MSTQNEQPNSYRDARLQLRNAATLSPGWDTYGSEPPNDVALSLATKMLEAIECDGLPPARLAPSAEGGIAISFVQEDKRAEIEIYNTGEIAVATYSGPREPFVWEAGDTESIFKPIAIIREALIDRGMSKS